MIYPILTDDDPVLRKKSRKISRVTKRIRKLAADMAETMYDAPGVGLAAPQIGASERLIVVDIGQGLITLINPEIVEEEGKDLDVEGCLSLPDLTGYVPRAQWVKVMGYDLKGHLIKIEGEGLLARALQHEIDHLDGVLFTDRAISVSRKEEEECD